MSDSVLGVTHAAEEYMNCLHNGDVTGLRDLFLSDARLFASIDDQLQMMPIKQYLELVAGRPSPASEGHENEGRIVSVNLSGPASAVVMASLAVPPRRFVDLLTFLKVGGAWKIIAKVYHVES